MVLTVILSLLAGIIGGNAFPHFVKGITRENYPNVFGGTPISNLIAGWAGFVVSFVVICFAKFNTFPIISAASVALGVLLIGIFHAGPGAFGRVPVKKDM